MTGLAEDTKALQAPTNISLARQTMRQDGVKESIKEPYIDSVAALTYSHSPSLPANVVHLTDRDRPIGFLDGTGFYDFERGFYKEPERASESGSSRDVEAGDGRL